MSEKLDTIDSMNLITLGDAAKLMTRKLTIGCLYFYYYRGILNPKVTTGKVKLYDKEDTLKRLDLIGKHLAEGKSLAQIKVIFDEGKY